MSREKIEKLHRRTFTVEFKVEAVKLKREQALTYAEVGRRLNVSPRLIRHWEKQYDAGELTPEQAKRRISPESQEISELRAQVSRLKMENAILKNLSRGRTPTQRGETFACSLHLGGRRERPLAFWWSTPLKNMVQGLWRTRHW